MRSALMHDVVGQVRVTDLGLEPFRSQLDLSAGPLNFTKNGMLAADALTAVSRTFAREIQTPEDGFGLDGLLREIGFDERTAAPVVGIVSRLTPQKGFDLCFETLPAFLAQRNMRLVALGSGEPRYEEFFQGLERQFPGKAWFYRGYNEKLAHQIEAGADVFLMPSKFEPCGLNQMYSYSLRYGTPPVVRKTGGLADTVEPFDPRHRPGNRLRLRPLHPLRPRLGPRPGLTAFHHHPAWEALMANGMRRDFSWDVQGGSTRRRYGWLAG